MPANAACWSGKYMSPTREINRIEAARPDVEVLPVEDTELSPMQPGRVGFTLGEGQDRRRNVGGEDATVGTDTARSR